MKKTLLIFTIILGVGWIGEAYADTEAVEMTLSRLEVLQKQAQNVQEKLKEGQAKLNETRQGVYGKLGAVTTKIENVKNMDIKVLDSMKEAIEKNNSKDVEDSIEQELIANYTNQDQNKTFIDNKDKVDAVKRENVSRLYAYAFTVRSNMQKTRNEPEQDPDIEMLKGREGVQAVNQQVVKAVRRLINIWDMQASLNELFFTHVSLKHKVVNRDGANENAAEGGAK